MRGYKQTEVGVIPDDWNAIPLGNIGEVIRGASPRPKGDKRFYGGNIPRVMVEDITRDKHWVMPSIDFLTDKGAKLSRLCTKGTLIVVCSGTPSAVGLPALLAVDACIHDGIMALVEIEKGISSEFLFHQLSSLQKQLHAAATHGGTFVNLTTDGFRSFKVALPSTNAEQQVIAAALTDVDSLLTSMDALIAKKRLIQQGAMQELLMGKHRLPGFIEKHGYIKAEIGLIPEDWTLWSFGEVVSIRNQKVDPHRSTNSHFCVELENIGQGDGKLIGNSETNETSSIKNRFEKGDVLFGKLRAYLRKYWLADRDGVCSTEIWPLIANKSSLVNSYLFQIVKTDSFIESASIAYGTHMPRADWNVIKNYKIPLPGIPEQQAIATVLSDMDAEIHKLEQQRDKTRLMKDGMMQELLTGKTRLI
jgi:type I restriction enzyme S subunit